MCRLGNKNSAVTKAAFILDWNPEQKQLGLIIDNSSKHAAWNVRNFEAHTFTMADLKEPTVLWACPGGIYKTKNCFFFLIHVGYFNAYIHDTHYVCIIHTATHTALHWLHECIDSILKFANPHHPLENSN